MTATMLEATDLSVGYPGRVVGSGLSLALQGGEVLALLGPNGCEIGRAHV